MTVSDVDCTKCGGTGLVKFFWPRQWLIGQCDRCEGFGVDPNAKPKHGPTHEQSAGEK